MIYINPDLIRQRPEGSQQPSWVWTGSSPTCYDLLSPPRSSSRSAPADRSAGGRIQSWSWALPSDSEGGRRGSTRSQTDWPPSDLPSPVLQRGTTVLLHVCRRSSWRRKIKKIATYRLLERCEAPWVVSPAVDLSWIPPVAQAQAEGRGSENVNKSHRRSLQNSGRAPEATGGQTGGGLRQRVQLKA